MITRVTSQTMMQSAQRNLQSNMVELAKLQEQATSQKAITRPSDDPAAAADSLRVRGEQRATEQYARNISNGNGWLTTIDAALASTTDLMNEVRFLTVRGANDGSMSPASKEAIAVELEGLKEALLKQANTSYLGRNVFAGNSSEPAAFTATESTSTDDPPVTTTVYGYNGDNAGTVERRISAETQVRVDADGAAVFGKGDASVFALIDNIVGDLRAGTNVGPRLNEIDTRMNAILGQHAEVGIRHAQILRAEETNMEQAGRLEARRSSIEDIDLGKIILDLKLQEVAYQSSLAVTARVLQPTLMDFLR